MTAEVAVLNKSAVALAADSKVTISSPFSGSEKTYDTVNKIFTLSKVHPVGVMIYGSADFMEYPWETIVKLYRSAKKAKSERTISEWGDDFWRFVRRFGPITARERANNVAAILNSRYAEIEEGALRTAHRRNITDGSPKYREVLAEVLQRQVSADLAVHKQWATKAQTAAIISKYGELILRCASQFQFPKNSKNFDLALSALIISLTFDMYSAHRSGVVIAGFGAKQHFPAMAHYSCDGYIGPRLKLMRHADGTISMQNGACIQAFAQGDIVHRFMEGIDPSYSDLLKGLVRTALIESNLGTFEQWAPKTKVSAKARDAVKRLAEAQYRAIEKRALSYRNRKFARQILDMVSILPKDELANLADSLVSLTSLHRRVSHDLETVGGAVDVAVISKSDGFVWIKRKHYFKPELNPHFAHNYMRDTQGARK